MTLSDRNWLEILGWGSAEIDDLRIVAYSYLKQGIYDTALTFFNALTVLAPPHFMIYRRLEPFIYKWAMDSKHWTI